jgi:CHAT domain-containing protein
MTSRKSSVARNNAEETRPQRAAKESGRRRLGSLTDLARYARVHHDRWQLCDQIEEILDPIKRAGIWTVVGETGLLTQLIDRVQRSLELFHAIAQHPSEDALEELETLLEDETWDVAVQVLRELRDRLDKQQEMIRHYAEQVAEWRDRVVDDLRKCLERARKAQAPVLREVNEFRQLDALVARADRMLKEPNYVEVAKTLHQLAGLGEAPRQLAEQLDKKEKEGRQFTQQADLLLLQSPLDTHSRRLQYTVLLRTPSEPGTHGINIESSSTLVEEDSTELRSALDRVTEAINHGLCRRVDLAQTAGLAIGAVAGMTRNLVTGPAGDRTITPPVPPNELIQDAGELLYRLVIPEQMQPFLTGTPFSLTITTNDLELPWELMFVEDEFLCLRLPVARMPMGRAVPRRPRLRGIREKLRFLLIYSDPDNNLPLACQEVEKIGDALRQDWQDKIIIDTLMPPNSSGRRLNEALRKGQYDVIHYAGHAGFDKRDGDLSGLLLHGGELFFAQKVRRLLEGRPLVFLNACESAFTANEQEAQQVDRYLQGPAEGLASAFIYGGAVGCIGSLWPVYDAPAAEFAILLYRRVLEGYTIGEAMRQARVDIRAAHPEQITWATFVLYGDPRFHLVD